MITLKDDFQIANKRKQLEKVDADQSLRLIWAWIKQDIINFGVFKLLMREVGYKVERKRLEEISLDEEW